MNGRKSVIPLTKSVLGLAASAVLLLWPAPAPADVFEWTDDQGGTHFSDNPGTIPEKYRKNARRIGGEAPKKCGIWDYRVMRTAGRAAAL